MYMYVPLFQWERWGCRGNYDKTCDSCTSSFSSGEDLQWKRRKRDKYMYLSVVQKVPWYIHTYSVHVYYFAMKNFESNINILTLFNNHKLDQSTIKK